jgi:hypothetical protein
MRFLAVVCLLAASAAAQSQERKTYVFDGDGRRQEWLDTRTGDHRSSQTVRNVNGARVPLTQTEEKIVRDQGGVRVVERTVRDFDSSGNPLPPVRTVIETTTLPGGDTSEKVTVYRGNINGSMDVAERVVSQTHQSGNTSVTTTAVERITVNGGFAPVERRTATATVSGDTSRTDTVLFRPDVNGRLSESGREVVQQVKKDNRVEERRDEYEVVTSGAPRLARQTVSTTVTSEDGSQQRVTDVFGAYTAGRVDIAGSPLQLRERQLVTVKVKPDGSAVETYSIQRPSATNPREMEPPVKLSETVCTGDCRPAAPPKPEKPAEASTGAPATSASPARKP